MIKEEKIEWDEIQGFEGLYKISTTGKVWGLKTDTILSPALTGKGYPFVSLSKNGNKTSTHIHRIVAETFLGEQRSESKSMVLHKDDDKENNHVDNLYWGDRSDNARDRRRNNKRRQQSET